MASETEDSETAAERLEAALERIAQLAERAPIAREQQPVPIPEITRRLDSLIDRLRAALETKA